MNTALVVEDSLTETQLFVGCLQRGGLNVMTASSSEEALTRINYRKPDVIILDVVLPDRSGFELCRELKEDDNTRAIPVILCSTKDSDMDKFWGLKQGADAYLPKPIDQEELLRTVRKVMQN